MLIEPSQVSRRSLCGLWVSAERGAVALLELDRRGGTHAQVAPVIVLPLAPCDRRALDIVSVCRPLPATGYEIGRWVYGRKGRRDGHASFAPRILLRAVPAGGCQRGPEDHRVNAGHAPRSPVAIQPRAVPETVVNAYRTNDPDLPAGPKCQQWYQSRGSEWAE